MDERGKLLSIHFLRFVAALCVVLHHVLSLYGTPVSVGAAGVDVFFVISGIVIGLNMGANESPFAFAMKRLIRVIPLYWIATLIYVVVSHVAWGNSPGLNLAARSAVLWPVFGTDWHPIYYPAWTLEYEMFFYAVATFSILAFGRFARTACLVFMVFISVVPIPVPFASPRNYFATDLCIEFCAGLLIAGVIIQRTPIDRRVGMALTFGALCAFAINYSANSIPRPMAWGIPSVMLVLGTYSFEGVKWFRHRWAALVGNASYALYLVHISAIEGIGYLSNKCHFPLDKHPVVALAVMVPAAVGLSVLLCLYVEQPLLRILRSFFLPQRQVKTV